ncbi:hypothetical protein SAY86_017652 [Trapa natans]|uniref:Uncharacterized protein n=1 Tax=Trapa natans TaxID=22666 RepID=A0AAN7LKW1_TRANT|nr:hypothetical protein SAY86_017652 [Trapa natans]
MAVGDEPWHDFVNVVGKIHIYTKEEWRRWPLSCLEQSPAVMEASSKSSPSGPDSSPTVLSI